MITQLSTWFTYDRPNLSISLTRFYRWNIGLDTIELFPYSSFIGTLISLNFFFNYSLNICEMIFFWPPQFISNIDFSSFVCFELCKWGLFSPGDAILWCCYCTLGSFNYFLCANLFKIQSYRSIFRLTSPDMWQIY